MVDGTGLENQRGATHRGFESRPLRQENALFAFYKNEIILAAGGAITAGSSTAAANTAT